MTSAGRVVGRVTSAGRVVGFRLCWPGAKSLAEPPYRFCIWPGAVARPLLPASLLPMLTLPEGDTEMLCACAAPSPKASDIATSDLIKVFIMVGFLTVKRPFYDDSAVC